MTFGSVLKRLLSRESPNRPESGAVVEENRQPPARSTSQTELVELFSAELQDHELLSDSRRTQSHKS
ncbi:hypothetical protein RA27_02460 [Ruegeria sp. ANG-R]|nr:hypothetical protein RA27_02460 [Ruegeria sp. ANG-R]